MASASVYWIWMQQLFGIGTARAHMMQETFDSPELLFEAVRAKEVPLEEGERLRLPYALENARRCEEATLKKRVDIITPDHPDYPELLHSIYSKPLALYVKGTLSCLREGLPIAMVGTRKASDYGRKAARDFAGELAKAGCVIVSGLALGIDSACHIAALENGGDTVGVMGCGIDIDYPPGTAEIKSAMKNRGAVISEYPIGTGPKPGTFPPRNRVIAGMTRGTIVVEAGILSGALITARHALDMGRDVFAVPGDIYSAEHLGIHRLLKEGGAKPVVSAAEVLEEYPEYIKSIIEANRVMKTQMAAGNADRLREFTKKGAARKTPVPLENEPSAPPQKPELPEGTDSRLSRLYAHVGENPKTAGVLAAQAGTDVGGAMAGLTELEIMGFVKSHPGGFFSI